MYFPYIRAKQYDLAALVELSDHVYNNGNVIPIIEPVTLIKNNQFKRLSARNIPFLLVVNPIVGDLKSIKPEKTIIASLVNDVFKDYKNFWLAFTIQHETTLKDVETFISAFPKHYHAFIHFHKFRDASALAKVIAADKQNQYNLFVDGGVGSDYINQFSISSASDILIRDGFKKRSKNQDYPSEDFFYDLHRLYDAELGYDGFGDFTVIGSQFDTGGGPAYVVALHLTDMDDDDNLIVRHFKSDEAVPPSPADPGGKFLQALRRLKRHTDASTLDTDGIDEYMELHRTGHFPGLGTPKKISIKHHIELVHSFL